MYDSILVPTDGSSGTEQALEHAVAIAGRFDATLHTIHVVQTPDFAEELGEMESVLDRLERAGSEAIEAVTEQARSAGHDRIESSIVQGIPAEEIIGYVVENDIDVVVMSTAGRTGDAREMVGSVTEAVVREAPVPVLTVNVG